MEQNERAKELYAMGFFAPENAQASLIALDMMDFEGIQTVKEKVMQGQTLLNMVMQMSQQLSAITGVLMPQEETQTGGGTDGGGSSSGGGNGLASGIMEAQTPMKMCIRDRVRGAKKRNSLSARVQWCMCIRRGGTSWRSAAGCGRRSSRRILYSATCQALRRWSMT